MNRKPAATLSTAEFNKAAHQYLAGLRTQRELERIRMQSLQQQRNVPDLRQHTRMVVLP